MRSRHEWLRLLERQAADLQSQVDYLYACRCVGSGVEEARALFDQALQIYRATMEAAPLELLGQHALETARSTRYR